MGNNSSTSVNKETRLVMFPSPGHAAAAKTVCQRMNEQVDDET